MIRFEDVVSIVRSRQQNSEPLLEAMLDVQQRYNADWVVPYDVPEDLPPVPAGTPQLVAETIDNLGMRAAGVLPDFTSLPLNPTKLEGVKSIEYAAIREKAIGLAWAKSRFNLGLRRAFRHLAGYATTTLVVQNDAKLGLPVVAVRNPLQTYPQPKAPEDLTPIENCAFVHRKAASWILANYPEARGIVTEERYGSTIDEWDLVEWIDSDCHLVGLLGPSDYRNAEASRARGNYGRGTVEYGPDHLELRRWPNPWGMCTVTTPRRITMDAVASTVAQMTDTIDLMARLQTLSIIATEKAIFPDRYVVGDSQRSPRLVNGEWADGRTGEVNLLLDAKSVGTLPQTPDPSTNQLIDRLERNVRISTGLVPQMGGETYGAMRTGRGVDALMGAAVDPRLQEMQETMAPELERVNELLLEGYKTLYPSKKYTVFSPLTRDTEAAEFLPSRHVETTDNVVSYPFPGLDIQGVTIMLGQLFGMKAMSLDTVRKAHPNIADAATEGKRVEREVIEQSVIESLVMQAQSGEVPVTYLAKVAEFRVKEPSIIDAVMKADAWLKAEQAKEQPPPEEGQLVPPATMPGLAPPGAMPPLPMPPPPPGELPEDIGIPGEIGARSEQKDFRRLSEALSATPPAGAV